MEIRKKLFFFVGMTAFVSTLSSCNQPAKKEENQSIGIPDESFLPVPVTLVFDSLVPVELSEKQSIRLISPKSGKLKKGDVVFKNGRFVRKGDLVVQLSFDQDYNELVKLKKQLSVEVNEFLAITLIQGSQNLRMKWKAFADELSPAKRLPLFPLIDSEEEKRALKETMIGKYFLQATALERSIDEAFVFSPVTGWLNKVVISIGDEVTQGQLIATLTESRDWYVKNKSSLDQLKGEKWPIVVNSNKEIGKLVRGTRSTYSIQFTPGIALPSDNKFFIRAKQSIQAQRIPKSCLKNAAVWTVQNGQEKRVTVRRMKQSVDSVWVIGLPEKCVLKRF